LLEIVAAPARAERPGQISSATANQRAVGWLASLYGEAGGESAKFCSGGSDGKATPAAAGLYSCTVGSTAAV
jgi:hypothetical protein